MFLSGTQGPLWSFGAFDRIQFLASGTGLRASTPRGCLPKVPSPVGLSIGSHIIAACSLRLTRESVIPVSSLESKILQSWKGRLFTISI